MNCESCTGGAASDCSLCASGYFLHPTTSVCSPSCPDGYFQDNVLRTCPLCDSSCLTCSDSASHCLSCSAQHFSSGPNECSPCHPLCKSCSGAENSMCTGCVDSAYLVDGTTTCVSECSLYAANYYSDGSICKACHPYC